MTAQPMVQILLAAYNGERYLRAQIDSILAQTWTNLRILARDDGSRDQTPAILESYSRSFPDRFELAPPSLPSGSAKGNFLRLLESSTADYIAFADQDDVWIPARIDSGMKAMQTLEQAHGVATPLLIFSDLQIVDSDLRVLHASLWRHQGINPAAIHRLNRLLTHNVVTGCTALINRPLAQLALRMPEQAVMHDWWIALLACCFGHADYQEEPTVLYRQHAGNVLGATAAPPEFGMPRWRWHRLRMLQWEASWSQAEAFLRAYRTELSAAQRDTLEAYLRCGTSDSRLLRTFTMVRHGFWLTGLRRNGAMLWLLWDLDQARKQRRSEHGSKPRL